ncbi:MAG TPA: metallopeptidase family protein, partial [Myxococcota bacterium]|nr:metallopeptidase family protein [Myxococcota bacterium]
DCQQAIFLDGRNAEAHYAAAVIAEFEGRYIEADVNYRTAAALDSENFPMPCREESDEQFKEMIAEAFQQISEECGSEFEDVIVTVEDLPALEEFAETGLSPLSTGYLALPSEPEGVFTSIDAPPIIVIFKRNVERMSRTPEDLRREVEFAIVNELMNLYEEFDEPIPKSLEDRADDDLLH